MSPIGSDEDPDVHRDVVGNSGSGVGDGVDVGCDVSAALMLRNCYEVPATFSDTRPVVSVRDLCCSGTDAIGVRVAVVNVSLHDHSRNETCAKGGVHGRGPCVVGEC